MFAKGWRLILPVLFIAAAATKPKSKSPMVKPAVSKEEAGKPVTGDWLMYHSSAIPSNSIRSLAATRFAERNQRIHI